MSSRRALILWSVLLILLTGYVSRRLMQPLPVRSFAAAIRTPPPLAGKNAISGLEVRQGATGLWTVDFDYFYTGQPAFAELGVLLDPDPDASDNPYGIPQFQTLIGPARRGKHHLTAKINYPSTPQERTLKVGVAMVTSAFTGIIARQQIDQVIDWPDYQTWQLDEYLAKASPEQSLQRAAELIDSDSEPQLNQAKAILEKLLQQNPNLDEGYVQLARIALDTNWGPEGFRQAKELLATALHIRPDSANAKILLAHVYAHENNFARAQALFSAAAATATKNLWVWSNWGEMLEAEHKDDQAIVMYRKAVSHPMTHDTYDRARSFAYDRLLDLLQQRRDYDGMEALYKQRIAEFGPGSCYSADYTRFLLQVRGDAQAAIDLARRALNQSCDDTVSRELLGLAEYVKYAAATGPAAEQALDQAHIYLPPGPKVLYLLAQSDRTVPAARRLIATGEKIDEKDNEQLDALAYALEARDYAAARRLVKLGARPDTPVSPQKVPVAFLPVVSEDIAGVLTMRQLGVDYSRIRYRGATAFDVASRLGDSALLTALGSKGVGL